jgi:hypothetical protein
MNPAIWSCERRGPAWRFAGCVMMLLALAASGSSCHNAAGPSGPAVALTANVVNPDDVDAVSKFDSCSGHAFPEQTSTNSGKNYFWPNSTNFSSTGQIQEFAACDGTMNQNSDDTNANEQDRGQTVHLFCDNSSTMVRYFHLAFRAGLLGEHVTAGTFLGYATLLGTGQSPSATWQNSSNFDIAVSENDDNTTEDYFAKLGASAFGAWAARGVTAVSQTINPGNPVCASFTSTVGNPDILSFTPIR